MSVKLIAENILDADDFSSATEQEGEYIGQPVPDSDNTGDFRLLSANGDITDFSYSGTATTDGAAGGTTVIDSVLFAFGDDYFIGGSVAITDFLQDTGDFSETDAAARIALTDANTVTVTDLDNDEDARLSIDKTADHFDGDFEFHVDIKCTANGANGDRCGVWALANTTDSLNDIDTASGDYFAVYWMESGGSDYFVLEECDGGTLYTDTSSAVIVNTQYYLKITRDDDAGTYGTVYCYIYDDEAMTSLVDTLTVALHTSKKDFRYLYWVIGYEGGGGGAAWDGVISDLEIVKSESKSVTDFAQSTGTLTISAFTYQVNIGTAFTLTVAFATRDFRVELIDAGDVGNATFKWSHDGGTTYLGRDDPNQANWLNKTAAISDVHQPSGAKDYLIVKANDGTILLFYLDNTDSQKLKCSRSIDNGLTWGSGIDITGYEAHSIFWPISLSNGRILLYHWATGINQYRISYSDDYGLTWTTNTTSYPNWPTSIIELYNGNLILAYGDNPVNIQKSIDGGLTWCNDVIVNATANAGTLIQTRNGNIICAYQTDEDSAGDDEIKCKISEDGGTTWGSAILVMEFDQPVAGDEYIWPNLTKDINGRIYCLAEKSDDNDIVYTYSDDDGETWNYTTAAVVSSHGSDEYEQPRAIITDHSTIIAAYSNTTDSTIEIVRRGIWEAYSANACPCAIKVQEQKLICDVGVSWHGGSGETSNPDKWSFTPDYSYTMKNLIEDSPSKPWRSEQDNIACNIVIDLGANETFRATGIGLFGCNIRTCSFQMNATDSWGSPSVDESISFDVDTGTVDAVSGNAIQDTSLLANYKDHALAGMYLRMTSGTDNGVTWQIRDNAGDYIFLETTASINIAVTDTFAIFQSNITKTFTGGIYRFMRIAIPAQHTADDYYQIGSMVVGQTITLSDDFSVGYGKSHVYDIDMLRTPHGGMIPIKGADRKRIFELNWQATSDTQEELVAVIDYVEGKNIVLIPDHSDLTDCYLVKHIGDLQQKQRYLDYFDVTLTFEEIL
jgi:hypothetical protein